ncbi:Uncharacterised protein [Brevundimonas diminuta]|jgi:hypothetical protein|uniref:hypothetical protein n=1 Tax=Brevundimonas TaxID=41275 RepID=UPI000207F769|nr:MULTISPECIES: hypothetical protein [Brevundimonas]EGF94638.1 hypothetical protein BDIM_14620 [Brevundimonas diminuta ATCC 11568]OWR21735.1 hypothetical protein CD944_04760 [Brevundimonas diminuta]WQE46587.1 hypothetical protein U0020_07010 [Brevundimonas diminuta]SPU47955.1 Uncharacterised protein [Brevundimonas diminuta]SUW15841.1 Uncharacterised protein [Brevundimonas diminuta]
MTFPHLQPAPSVNWAKVSFLFGAAVTIATWVVFGAQTVQRVQVLEERTAPLASGDLIRVQTDVAWIRQRLEQERGQ